MVSLRHVEEQLKKVGCNFRFWGRAEIRELGNVLTPDETIAHCVNGHYEGGFAMLCVTDQRLLLIDRKPMFMAMEDIRFEMISEVDFSQQLLMATVRVVTPNRTLHFGSWSQHHLREVLNYTQQRMLELRQHYATQQQLAAAREMEGQIPGGASANQLAFQVPGAPAHMRLPLNPYVQSSMTMRRNNYPKFY
jgi:hypothetical protein